jgi:hypothetical protein
MVLRICLLILGCRISGVENEQTTAIDEKAAEGQVCRNHLRQLIGITLCGVAANVRPESILL